MPLTGAYYQPELTLPDLLVRAVQSHEHLFIGYSDKNGSLLIQTYKNLLAEADRIACGLFNLGLRQGDTIIIATQNNKETIEILWGSFLLGLIPTILQPPMTFSGYNPAVVKLINVCEQLKGACVFMSSELNDPNETASLKIKMVRDLDCRGTYPKPELKPDDLAFIQFSSGSSGDPKGIMLTHHNLMVNMDAIRIGLDAKFPDIIGNWMPLFHDMGLIGYHLTPIYCGLVQYHIETIDFIMNPGLWLNLMSNQKVAITGCTNFALALVLRYFTRKKPVFDWDFSYMKAMLNGAEPISVITMQDFIRALEPFGYRPEAMMPVYGMAEATLAISFSPLMTHSLVISFDAGLLDHENLARPVDPSEPSARLLSEVGVAINDVEIRIMDEQDQPLPAGFSGQIQLKGPGITKGYYNNPEVTASVFCGEWLSTGDIGFFYEGRLYISGRSKDIIFKNGRNYFANDLESMACSVDEIKYGKVCFGGITGKETGQDKVVAFAAGFPDEKAPEIFRKLRALLRSNLGITVDELVLIKTSEIPRTSSGKIQRFRLMQRYSTGEFDDRKVLPDSLNSD